MPPLQPLLSLAQAATGQPPANSQNYAIWAVILLGVAVVLFFTEIIVPSGGVLGFCSTISLIAGIVLLFKINTTLGLIGAIIAMIALPFLFAFAIKVWPHTPIAQMLLLRSPPRPDVNAANDHASPIPTDLVGRNGSALTDLHPVGTCLIDGQRVQCLAETCLIRSGTPVRVIAADGIAVKVRSLKPDTESAT